MSMSSAWAAKEQPKRVSTAQKPTIRSIFMAFPSAVSKTRHHRRHPDADPLDLRHLGASGGVIDPRLDFPLLRLALARLGRQGAGGRDGLVVVLARETGHVVG